MLILDLKRAFDLVSHKILLNKLELYRCHESALKWFQSYLTNRIQRTTFKEYTSSPGFISLGVPQGSVLGPLLFIIFLSDLPLAIDSSVDLYADGSAIITNGKTVKDVEARLQIVADDVGKWCKENNMAINCNKSKVMLVSTKKRVSHIGSPDLILKYMKSFLRTLTHTKYLV